MFVVEFFLWTFCLYWLHRLGHKMPIVKDFHFDHHRFILKNDVDWHWNNLFLINDNLKSTIDLWLTEVIPTLIISLVLGAWWLSIFYYIWAATIQERIEHRSTFDLPFLTSGKWHLIHHTNPKANYGLFFPIWDVLFGTYESTHEKFHSR